MDLGWVDFVFCCSTVSQILLEQMRIRQYWHTSRARWCGTVKIFVKPSMRPDAPPCTFKERESLDKHKKAKILFGNNLVSDNFTEKHLARSIAVGDEFRPRVFPHYAAQTTRTTMRRRTGKRSSSRATSITPSTRPS